MDELLIPILIILFAPAIIIIWSLLQSTNFFNWIKRLKPSLILKRESNLGYKIIPLAKPDLGILNCRARTKEKNNVNSNIGVFTIEICGSIHCADTPHKAAVQITIMDITDGCSPLSRGQACPCGGRGRFQSQLRWPKAKPVHTSIKQWQKKNSPIFYYTAEIGSLTDKITRLFDWTAVAQIHLDWLIFPRKGKRNLQFHVSIISTNNPAKQGLIQAASSGQELASAKSTLFYENSEFGYVDLQDNIQRSRILSIPLAFAVSAADKKIFNSELQIIKDWAIDKINFAHTSNEAKHQFETALNRTITFFRNGNQIDIYGICKEIVNITPFAERCDTLELCMRVARAKGSVSTEELNILRNLTNWLNIDNDRFRAMMEKNIPVNIYHVKDAETILGVSPDMNKETTRKQLNQEYIKWNSRVISSNPEVQAQADQMLKLIAEARSEYVGLNTSA